MARISFGVVAVIVVGAALGLGVVAIALLYAPDGILDW